MNKYVFLLLLLMPFFSFAEVEEISFEDEELAKESVLPKFEKFSAVKNKVISFDSKFEFGVFKGYNLTEALYSDSLMGVNFTYHLGDIHGINFNYASVSSGLSTYSEQISAEYLANPPEFDRAPMATSQWFLNHEAKLFYGKISITKQTNFNLSMYTLLGLGQTIYSHKSYLNFTGGIGQRFYITPQLSLRFDMKMIMGQSPYPYEAGKIKKLDPKPQASDFKDVSIFSTHFDLGVSYLF